VRRGQDPLVGHDVAAPARQQVFLHAGHVLATARPTMISTILGSCVAVCLWDPGTGVGGLNHFQLPVGGGPTRSPRFGDVAMEMLLTQVVGAGARPASLRAMVFGGACVIEALRQQAHHLGLRNVELAFTFLASRQVPVLREDVGGQRGRKLLFTTDTGDIACRRL
jgi:chemotaxis protein CheD